MNLDKDLRVATEGPECADFDFDQALDHWNEELHKYFQ